MRRKGADRGYRYEQPELIHFCLLRGVRIVSALNASIELAHAGFTQEIAVILRTVLEFKSQVDFMLASRDPNGTLSAEASQFLLAYFDDAERGAAQQKSKTKLVQKTVHEIIGARLESIPGNRELSAKAGKSAAQMYSNVYMVFSNYVHGRYPESIDLYGGIPGRFHLNGMRHTPKDQENILVLDDMINSASLCLVGIVQELNLRAILERDPMLQNWYRNSV